MANYNYDEAGNMAAYFLLTFLLIVLVPLSLPSSSAKQQSVPGCDCQDCLNHRARIRRLERGSLLHPKFRRKTLILLLGWTLFGYLSFKIATTEVENKVYNPFEILGIKSSASTKEIKSHYKMLSRIFHPDKVKLAVNETIEAVEARFIEITKAYKSLTDVTIRQNWERYGHPDGRQEVSMGIALPKWVVEGKNNVWVLGAYGLIFGAALPGLVGKWWFGNRQKTKDGVNSRSAAAFFKMLSEESDMDDIITSLGKSYEWERPNNVATETELTELNERIADKLGNKWATLKKAADALPGTHPKRHNAFILLYAHLLRLPINSSSLIKEQTDLLLQTPTLMNSLLNISISRNWLIPTLAAMRLHAYLAQALAPGQEVLKFAQLPGISEDEAKELAKKADAFENVVDVLEDKADGRVADVKKAVSKWGKIDLVDASFKVIDDRLVTPSSIVYLVVKVRLTAPSTDSSTTLPPSKEVVDDDERDAEFLTSRKDAEELPTTDLSSGWAHAPHWPANRRPGWWVVLADAKMNRVVVPPMKITDAPPNVSVFNWKLYLVSDTFIGEEVSQDIMLKIEDTSVLESEEQGAEDEISDPEEDSLAGQMAMMRGGTVKKRQDEEESDDESSTDDDHQSDNDDSSSDSD